MFQHRRRTQEKTTSDFVQQRRSLRGGESLPVIPGLLDQIMACRAEMQRSSRSRSETVEEESAAMADQEDLSSMAI